MDKPTATTEVQRLVGPSVWELLTPADIEAALTRALTPDSQDRRPDQPSYVPTYDPYWAAAEAVTTVAVRNLGAPGVNRFTSEGASFETLPPDLWAMAARLRGQSSLLAAPTTGLGVIEIDTRTGYPPTSGGWPTRLTPVTGEVWA